MYSEDNLKEVPRFMPALGCPLSLRNCEFLIGPGGLSEKMVQVSEMYQTAAEQTLYPNQHAWRNYLLL